MKKINLTAYITPELLAEMWCLYDAEEQARFFNHVACETALWTEGGLVHQINEILDHDDLTNEAFELMTKLGNP